MGITLIKIGVGYFLIGIGLGLYMAVTQDFTIAHVHGHVNLLGWVSLAICGLIYQQFPKLEQHILARLHFWLHVCGLPIAMVALFFYLRGITQLMPVLAVGSNMVGLGVLCFAVHVFMHLKSKG